MIFSAKDDKGRCKADLIAQLPIGAKFVSARKAKDDWECLNCGWTFEEHFIHHPEKAICPYTYSNILDDGSDATGYKYFFPAKFAIGKEDIVEREKGDGGLCARCGEPKIKHPDAICLAYPELGKCPVADFKPVKIRITGGMWRDEWFSKNEIHLTHLSKGAIAYTGKDEEIDAPNRIFAFLQAEAKLELMGTQKHFEKYMKEYNPSRKNEWRIEMEKII